MADVNEMRRFFEKILDEHGVNPAANDYRIVHQEVMDNGDPHIHTHLIAVPKKGNNKHDKN